MRHATLFIFCLLKDLSARWPLSLLTITGHGDHGVRFRVVRCSEGLEQKRTVWWPTARRKGRKASES